MSPVQFPKFLPRPEALSHKKAQSRSFCRLLSELFTVIGKSFWNSWACRNQELTIPDKTKERIKEIKSRAEKAQTEQHTSAATAELKKLTRLQSASITESAAALESQDPHLKVVDIFLHQVAKGFGEDFKVPTERFVAIPYVLPGHIVMFYVDQENKTIEYFDPKGLTVFDRSDAKLHDTYRAIRKTFGATAGMWENTQKVQFDSHNCGVYVLDYIERRSAGELPSGIVREKPLTFEKANGEKRLKLIKRIAKHRILQPE